MFHLYRHHPSLSDERALRNYWIKARFCPTASMNSTKNKFFADEGVCMSVDIMSMQIRLWNEMEMIWKEGLSTFNWRFIPEFTSRDWIKPRRSLYNLAGVRSCFGLDGFLIPVEDVDGSPFFAFGKGTSSN